MPRECAYCDAPLTEEGFAVVDAAGNDYCGTGCLDGMQTAEKTAVLWPDGSSLTPGQLAVEFLQMVRDDEVVNVVIAFETKDGLLDTILSSMSTSDYAQLARFAMLEADRVIAAKALREQDEDDEGGGEDDECDEDDA